MLPQRSQDFGVRVSGAVYPHRIAAFNRNEKVEMRIDLKIFVTILLTLEKKLSTISGLVSDCASGVSHLLKKWLIVSNGSLRNQTDEYLLVYGPKLDGSATDNSLFLLPARRQTPAGWDCDGFYVPSDRIAKQLILQDQQGPVAVKYVNVQFPTITLVEVNKYYCPGNLGIVAPGELNWPIPNLSYSQIQMGFPEVPGHTAI